MTRTAGRGAAFVAAMGVGALAATAAGAQAAPDRAYGAYLASECVTCHQPSGADAGIPSIVGRPVPDFRDALIAYRSKLRPNPVMQTVASRLTDADIEALAAYFESIAD